ncbi:hypothetical protein GALMADRAFT_919416 [Galerina marginata CBS 339.88]|uniref:Uncharacterized protein n=1 Tax=Galerina marginata (strain CBS 339.88) TaxID=685588 RepID=A0A067SER6_GALM3|nr:hypothetical protein GALMADRAFT_919416 [Galerina marginata CBS 339.88]
MEISVANQGPNGPLLNGLERPVPLYGRSWGVCVLPATGFVDGQHDEGHKYKRQRRHGDASFSFVHALFFSPPSHLTASRFFISAGTLISPSPSCLIPSHDSTEGCTFCIRTAALTRMSVC